MIECLRISSHRRRTCHGRVRRSHFLECSRTQHLVTLRAPANEAPCSLSHSEPTLKIRRKPLNATYPLLPPYCPTAVIDRIARACKGGPFTRSRALRSLVLNVGIVSAFVGRRHVLDVKLKGSRSFEQENNPHLFTASHALPKGACSREITVRQATSMFVYCAAHINST